MAVLACVPCFELTVAFALSVVAVIPTVAAVG